MSNMFAEYTHENEESLIKYRKSIFANPMASKKKNGVPFETSGSSALLRVLIFYEYSKLRNSFKIRISGEEDWRWGQILTTLSGKIKKIKNIKNS